MASLMDALSICEFLAAYGIVLGGTPAPDLQELQAAVAWPLEGANNNLLAVVYVAMLRFLFAQWVSWLVAWTWQQLDDTTFICPLSASTTQSMNQLPSACRGRFSVFTC